MRILFCGVAAVALSGCSFLGLGNDSADTGYDGYYAKSNSDCCVGGKSLARWNIEGGVGPEFIVGGDAVTGGSAHLGNTFPTTVLGNVSMNDAYDTGTRAELGGSYALNPNRKLTAQAFLSQANGNEVTWGTQNANALRGTMSDYKSYGVEAGLRQYFQPKSVPLLKSVRPYVEGKLGAAHLDSISMDNIRVVGGVADARTPSSLNMYQSGWVPTAAGLVGLETPVFKRMTVGVETGIRYTGGQKTDTTHTGGTGFNRRYSGFNNAGGRYTVPVTIRGRYRF